MVSTRVLLPVSVLIVPVWFLVAAATSHPPWEMKSPLATPLPIVGIIAWLGCMVVGARHRQKERPTFLIAVAAGAFIIAEFLGTALLSMLVFGSGIR